MGTESGTTLVFKGDNKDAIKKAKEVEAQTKKVAEEMERAAKKRAALEKKFWDDQAKAMMGTGKQTVGVFEKWEKSLGASLGRALLLRAAISGAAEQAVKFANSTAEASKGIGKTSLDRDVAAARLNLQKGDAEALTGNLSVKSREEKTSLLSDLARVKNLDRQSVFKASALFDTNAFDRSEIVKAAEEGRLDSLFAEVPGRRAKFGADTLAEERTRFVENEQAERGRTKQLGAGLVNREAQARIAGRNAENPGAAAFQGAVASGTSIVGGDAIIEAADIMAQSVRQQTRDLQKPTVAPGADQ